MQSELGLGVYHAALAEFFKDGDPEAIKAFNYFASKLTIEDLNKEPSIQTPRDLIVQASERMLDQMTLEEKNAIAIYNKNFKNIREGLYVSEAKLEIRKEFFGLMSYVTATYVNETGLSLSASDWVAELYLDNSTEPAATYGYTTNFGNGFDSGYAITSTRLMGHVSGNPDWITPAIQRASKKVVKIRPFIGSQKGLDLKYLTGTEEQLADFNSREENAKKWLAMFK